MTLDRRPHPPLPYDAVLCDVDGVLQHWPAAHEIEHAHGLPTGALAAATFAPARVHPAIVGEITDEQWRTAVAADLAAELDPMEHIVERLALLTLEEAHDLLRLLQAVARDDGLLSSDADRLGRDIAARIPSQT